MQWRSRRWHGLAGLLGGLLCLALTPIQAFIWSREASPTWVLAMRPLLDRYLAIYDRVGASLGLSDHYFFGRMFFLVYLLALLPLLAVHAGQSGRGVRLEMVGFRWSMVGLITAAVGDVGAYWGGSDPDGFAAIQGIAFMVEMLAILVILVGSVLYGIATLRAGVLPRWCGWLLICCWTNRHPHHGGGDLRSPRNDAADQPHMGCYRVPTVRRRGPATEEH